MTVEKHFSLKILFKNSDHFRCILNIISQTCTSYYNNDLKSFYIKKHRQLQHQITNNTITCDPPLPLFLIDLRFSIPVLVPAVTPVDWGSDETRGSPSWRGGMSGRHPYCGRPGPTVESAGAPHTPQPAPYL